MVKIVPFLTPSKCYISLITLTNIHTIFFIAFAILSKNSIGFCFSSEKQEPDIDQNFLKENIAWRSQVLVGFFLK